MASVPQDAQGASVPSHAMRLAPLPVCHAAACAGGLIVIPVICQPVGMPGRAGSDLLLCVSPKAATEDPQPLALECPAWPQLLHGTSRDVSPGLRFVIQLFKGRFHNQPPLGRGDFTQSRLSWGGHGGGSLKSSISSPCASLWVQHPRGGIAGRRRMKMAEETPSPALGS